MNEQAEKLIRDLAEKLGTTVEHLWDVLLRQAPIDSSAKLIGVAVAAVLFVITWFRIQKFPNEKNSYDFFSWREVAVGILIATSLLLAYLGVQEIPLILAGFFNPEYWALRQIIH